MLIVPEHKLHWIAPIIPVYVNCIACVEAFGPDVSVLYAFDSADQCVPMAQLIHHENAWPRGTLRELIARARRGEAAPMH